MPPKPPRLPSNTSRERSVTEEEKLLWYAVMEGAPIPVPAIPEPAKAKKPEATPQVPNPDQLERFLATGLQGLGAQPAQKTTPQRGVDWRTARQLRQGKTEPEATIDLHGSTQTEAHSLLASFLQRSAQEGKRAVLVITGKGSRAGKAGVLRMSLASWLSSAPCSAFVAAFAQAHIRHGGEGAFYVLLRKQK